MGADVEKCSPDRCCTCITSAQKKNTNNQPGQVPGRFGFLLLWFSGADLVGKPKKMDTLSRLIFDVFLLLLVCFAPRLRWFILY